MIENFRDIMKATRVPLTAGLLLGSALTIRSCVDTTLSSADKITESLSPSLQLPEELPVIAEKPAVVIAGVDMETQRVESTFELSCNMIVSAAVPVEAHQRSLLVSGVKIDKKLYGDYLLCGDETEVVIGVEERDPITGEVESIDVTIPGVVVEHPRVNFLDPRNCADINADASNEEVEAAMMTYLDARLRKDSVPCDDGFDVTGLGIASDDDTTIKEAVYRAAMLALTLNESSVEIMEQADSAWADMIADQLHRLPAYADAVVNVTVDRSDARTIEQQIAAIAEEYKSTFSSVEMVEEDGQIFVDLVDYSGAEIRVSVDAQQVETTETFLSIQPENKPMESDKDE